MGITCRFRTKNGCSYDCFNKSDGTKGISLLTLNSWDYASQLKLLAILGFSSNFTFIPKNFFICSEHFTPDSIEKSSLNGSSSLKKNPTVRNSPFEVINLQSSIRSFSDIVSGVRFFFVGKLPQFWHLEFFEKHVSFFKLMSKGRKGLVIAQEVCIDDGLKIHWLVNGIAVAHQFEPKNWESVLAMINEITSNEAPPQPSQEDYFKRDVNIFKKINWNLDGFIAFEYALNILKTLDMLQLDSERNLKWKILLDQLKNFFSTPRRFRYSWETRLVSSFVKNISTAAYKVLSNFFNLPSITTLNVLARNLHTTDNISFLKNAAARCTAAEKNVLIAIDEIALDSKIEYKLGQMNGFTHDGKVAKTAQGFFATSTAGNFSELICLRPINGCTASQLKEMLFEVIKLMQDCGFTVVCVVADNHTINQSLFKMLTKGSKTVWFPNPMKEGRKVFCRYDQVHLIKNIRNKWINQRDADKTMLLPNFASVIANPETDDHSPEFAKFQHIRNLFLAESNLMPRAAHRLTHNVCFPSVFEKQNVKLVDRLFDASTSAALDSFYGESVKGTVFALRLFKKWFDIQNVLRANETLNEDKMALKRETYQNSPSFLFLKQFVVYLDVWARMIEGKPLASRQGLTKMTHSALRFTTQSTIEFVEYMFEFHPEVDYLLLGKLSSDPIEDCFGKLRWFAGNSYRISVTQALESLKKMRMRTTLSWLINDPSLELVKPDLANSSLTEEAWDSLQEVLNDDKYINESPSIPTSAVVHIAGFCAAKCYIRLGDKCCSACYHLFADSKGGLIQGDVYQNLRQLGVKENQGLTIPSELGINVAHQMSSIIQAINQNVNYKAVFNQTGVHQQKVLWMFADSVLRSTEADPEKICNTCNMKQVEVLQWFIRPLCNTLLVAYKNAQNDEFKIAEAEKKKSRFAKSQQQRTDWIVEATAVDNEHLEQHTEDYYVASTSQQQVHKLKVLNKAPSTQAIRRSVRKPHKAVGYVSDSETDVSSASDQDMDSGSDVSLMDCDSDS